MSLRASSLRRSAVGTTPIFPMGAPGTHFGLIGVGSPCRHSFRAVASVAPLRSGLALCAALLLGGTALAAAEQRDGQARGGDEDAAQQATEPAKDEDKDKKGTEPRDEPVRRAEDVVVTASVKAERIQDLPVTIQVLDTSRIEATPSDSLTGLLAENSVAFFTTWTPAQTGINLRGGTSDGQGRDFRGQVVVLINGRRAGTANLSKLSPTDVERIEVLRGASSLIYGSQAIGGVVNIITKDPLQSKGLRLKMDAGSFGRVNGLSQYGGNLGRIEFLASAHAGRQGDYESGKGSPEKMLNTSYERYGGMLALGYTLSAFHRLTTTIRSDGIYGAGFRGSSWDLDNYDNRYNQSVDLVYNGSSSTAETTWKGHYYFFRDIDDFHWGSEVARSGDRPVPGLDEDNNKRRSLAHGLKGSASHRLFGGNDLQAGVDTEWWRLRNERNRIPVLGGPTSQTAPFDSNSDTWNLGAFVDDVQKLAADKLVLRAGIRMDFGQHTLKETPNLPFVRENTASYDTVTYRGGVTYRPSPGWGLRAGVGSGFRAATPTELSATFTLPLGGQQLGNPDLKPERTVSVEAGAMFQSSSVWGDLVLFHNDITDRISSVPIDQNRTQFANRASSDVTGLELQSRFELRRGEPAAWLSANGVYHFTMRDSDAAQRGLNSDRISLMYEYQGSLTLGVNGGDRWRAQLTGVLHGPIWYDTEENLLVPTVEVNRTFVHRKDPFSLFTFSSRVRLAQRVHATLAVYNLLNVNQHPTFIALNRLPYVSDPRFSNGGRGNSLPGREFVIGLELRP